MACSQTARVGNFTVQFQSATNQQRQQTHRVLCDSNLCVGVELHVIWNPNFHLLLA